MSERLRVLIRGRVQGVGFRYATVRQAEALGLTGWVRNTEDGGVEAEFEGPRPRLEEALDWCRHGPAFSAVTKVDHEWASGPARFKDFRVRF